MNSLSNATFLGIDPGASGVVAIIYPSNECITYKCPKTPEEMSDIIKGIKNKKKIKCLIENVHAFPTDARSRAFAFGRNFGTWLGILASYSIIAKLVTPSKWQSYFGPFPKLKKDRKNLIKDMAKERYPDAYVTLSTADAILIALYAKEEYFEI